MGKRLSLFLLGLYCQQGLSQHKLTGRFIDQAERAVPYLEVYVRSKDSTAIEHTTHRGAITDSSGAFTLNLPSGAYRLKASLFGKKVYEREVVVKRDLELGTLQLKTGLQLGEVAVMGRRKLIEQKADRLVFNVENAVAASGGDALDALRITPGLRVQNDQLSMIGRGRLRVMVDGRLLPLSGQDLTDYLQSISADDIKSIEVITTPPAKYQAEGNSGLINIIYKKGRKNAWNASLRGGYRQATYALGSGGTSFNYKKDRLSLAANADYMNGSRLIVDKNRFFYPVRTWSRLAPRHVFYRPIMGGRMAVDYHWNDRFLTGFQYIGARHQYRVMSRKDQAAKQKNGPCGFAYRLQFSIHRTIPFPRPGVLYRIQAGYFGQKAKPEPGLL